MVNSRNRFVGKLTRACSQGGRCCRPLKVWATSLVLSVLLAGCINTPLPDYYVITPEQGSLQVSPNLSDIALGIGPITIPETVNRPNIVTPRDINHMEVAEYHRWSEPLRENISRVVITNMAARLGLNKLYAYPWLGSQIDYQVRLDILQMIGSPQSDVYLQVRWQILTGGKPAKLVETRISEYRVPVQGDNYSSLVAAYSEAIASLTNELSAAVAAIAAEIAVEGAIFPTFNVASRLTLD